MCGYNLCGMQTCTEAGQGEPHLLIEEEKALFVRMYAFLLNEHPTHTHLSNWTFGAWELGCSRALLLSSDRQEDSLAAGGGRESRRGLLRWPWRFLPGPHTFLRTSGSCRGAVAVPPAGAGLGISLRWEEPGADEDLDLAVCCWKARLGITWLMAFARFWASANRSVMDSTASPKRPEGVYRSV